MGTNETTPGPHLASEGVFFHQCIYPGCRTTVQFDDEPWCFTHSPDEGSSLEGFSARKLLHEGAEALVVDKTPEQLYNSSVQHNVFASGETLPGEG